MMTLVTIRLTSKEIIFHSVIVIIIIIIIIIIISTPTLNFLKKMK